MLALRMLLRSWRGGRIGLIFASLAMAVAVVVAVALVADRVERGLVAESSSFLAADALVKSSQPIPESWLEAARERGILTARTVVFTSMVFHGDANHLASVKAVQDAYPLRGLLTLSTTPFATDASAHSLVDHGPAAGEAWVDGRILPLLGIGVGDSIDVGDVSLRVTQTVISEPDRGDSFSLFGARVLMNWRDLSASGLIQPGSRAGYRLLLSADDKPLADYLDWLRPQLNVHDKLLSPGEAQASLTDTLSRGRQFLLLAGSIGVVIAAIALALASRHFAAGEMMSVALMKSWGCSVARVRWLYTQQCLWLGLAGLSCGLLAGWLFHLALLEVMREWLPIHLPAAGFAPWLTGFATGLLCLLGFALPAMWHLPLQSPLAVLRQNVQATPLSSVRRFLIGLAAVLSLLLLYSGSLWLSLSLLAGFGLIVLLTLSLGWLMLRASTLVTTRAGGIWRLALANLWRNRARNLIQTVAFAAAISLLLTMVAIRGSLIDEWRWQLDDEAPNHFLVNVAPYELDGVNQLLAKNQLETVGWYSMVRGRITHINGEEPSEELVAREEELRRELNLSWTATLPENNSIVAGRWWHDENSLAELAAEYGPNLAPLSIEKDMAEEIGVTLGDQLSFSIGGLSFVGVVTSTRSLNWDSMTPNFYILFPEGILEQYPRTFMTSLYVAPAQKTIINDLLQQYPTMLVIELDIIIDRIRTIVSQVTWGLELITLLILGCGVLVMLTAVNLSMRDRIFESAILRTLGSSRRLILGAQWAEFSLLGLIAGLLGAIGAELAVSLLQRTLFDMPFAPHPWLWLFGSLFGGFLIGLMGLLYSRRAVVYPPLQVLRAI